MFVILDILKEAQDEIKIERKKEFANESRKKTFTRENRTFDLLVDEKERIFIPEEQSGDVLKKIHTALIPPRASKMYKSISSEIFIPKLKEKIMKITNTCLLCQRNKHYNN